VRFSQLVVEQRWVAEIDINPLLASPAGLLALDARVPLYNRSLAEEALPKLAIRPYPSQYMSTITLHDGSQLLVRPIRPEDEPLMVDFHHTLSEQSVYQRYFHPLALDSRIVHDRLMRMCFIDYDRQIALVAECGDAARGERQIAAVGRLIQLGGGTAEFALLVADRYQRCGLGSELLRQLLSLAASEGIRCVQAEILPENGGMVRICRQLGFSIQHTRAGVLLASIELP
jgi:acetyltransferase